MPKTVFLFTILLLANSLKAQTESGSINLGGNMSVITFDQNYVNNATDLALARTVIHELVHAYIKYQLVNQPGGDMGRADE